MKRFAAMLAVSVLMVLWIASGTKVRISPWEMVKEKSETTVFFP